MGPSNVNYDGGSALLGPTFPAILGQEGGLG